MKRDPMTTRPLESIDTHIGQYIVRTTRGPLDPSTAILFNLSRYDEEGTILDYRDPILFGPFEHAPESDTLTEHNAHVRRLLETITSLSRVETPANSES